MTTAVISMSTQRHSCDSPICLVLVGIPSQAIDMCKGPTDAGIAISQTRDVHKVSDRQVAAIRTVGVLQTRVVF